MRGAAMPNQHLKKKVIWLLIFGAFCLAVRTLTFCQRMGLNHEKLKTFSRGADFATE